MIHKALREFFPLATNLFMGLCTVALLTSCGGQTDTRDVRDSPNSPNSPNYRDKSETVRIAFGSCADDDAPNHPVWNALRAVDPDVLIMMGDNVYADSPEFSAAPSAEKMVQEYAKLSATPGFKALRETIPVLAIWDDHDYGLNDGGAAWPFKATAEKIFEDYWGYPDDDPIRAREGVYAERRVELNGIDVQVLLLDTRSFRGELVEGGRTLSCPIKNYQHNETGEFLGEAQWQWLAERLRAKADLRLLVSGQQVIADQHCFEKWGNFPHERLRLFKTLREAGASNALLLSGDRHLGEISLLAEDAPGGAGFDLFEVTSSPLSARSGFGWGETNDFRVSSDNLRESQFGVLDIERRRLPTGEQKLAVSMQLYDEEGAARFTQSVEFALSDDG